MSEADYRDLLSRSILSLADISAELYRTGALDRTSRDLIRSTIDQLDSSPLFSSPEHREKFLHDFARLDPAPDKPAGAPLKDQERISLSKECDYLRLLMFASGLWAQTHGGAVPSNVSLRPRDVVRTLHTGYGGLTYANVFENMVIVFPSAHSYIDCYDILAELSSVFELTPTTANWVLDFSTLTSMPQILLGSLLSYQIQLQERKRNVYVCWLSHEVVDRTAHLQRAVTLFDLERQGDHYFSKLDDISWQSRT